MLFRSKEKFTPTQFAQVVCSPRCAVDYTIAKKAKKATTEHAKAKKAFNLSDKPLQKKLTQALVNKIVRLIYAGKPGTTSGTLTGQMQAGH